MNFIVPSFFVECLFTVLTSFPNFIFELCPSFTVSHVKKG